MELPCPEATLEALMSDLESDLVERKESLQGDAPNRIRQAVCAFANDLTDHRRPGLVFVGARDDGTPSGLDVTDDLLLQLADIKTDGNIVPPPTLSVQKHILSGKAVAVVSVQPSDSPPVRTILAANDRSTEERLAATKMTVSADDPTPTVTGLLVLGTRPQDFLPGAYAQFLRIAGTDWGDPVEDEVRCIGPIAHLVARLDDKLLAHNRMAVDFTSAPVERRESAYPVAALQQLVRNAVMHRTYQGTNSPVRVYWFNDRIEISSPGGAYGTVTAETFGQPGIVDYRNPNLSEAMRVLGLVQRYGFGIPTARRELQENGHPEPDFRVQPNWVHCTLKART